MEHRAFVHGPIHHSDQIGLVQIDPGRIMMLQFQHGRVYEASFTSEERLVDSLAGQRAVPVVLFADTAHLAKRLSAEGFTTIHQADAG
jgi:hypothetical protein